MLEILLHLFAAAKTIVVVILECFNEYDAENTCPISLWLIKSTYWWHIESRFRLAEFLYGYDREEVAVPTYQLRDLATFSCCRQQTTKHCRGPAFHNGAVYDTAVTGIQVVAMLRSWHALENDLTVHDMFFKRRKNFWQSSEMLITGWQGYERFALVSAKHCGKW